MKTKIKNIYSTSLIILLIVIIAGYVFFFNSQKIFGVNYTFTISEVGTVLNFDNSHTAKLIRSDIDENKGLIEYEFSFNNENWDGFDVYIPIIKTTSKNGKIVILKSEVICSDSDIYVVRAALPRKWNVVVADLSLAGNDNAIHTKFYSDRNSLYKTSIKGNNRDYFIKLDASRSIENLQDNINELEQENINLEQKIKDIEVSINNTTNRLPYLAGSELEAAQLNINTMNAEKENALITIDKNKKAISELELDIVKLKEKLS